MTPRHDSRAPGSLPTALSRGTATLGRNKGAPCLLQEGGSRGDSSLLGGSGPRLSAVLCPLIDGGDEMQMR